MEVLKMTSWRGAITQKMKLPKVFLAMLCMVILFVLLNFYTNEIQSFIISGMTATSLRATRKDSNSSSNKITTDNILIFSSWRTSTKPTPITEAPSTIKAIPTTLAPRTACSFPNTDPNDPDITRYVKTYAPLRCSGMPFLVYLDGDYLKIDMKKVERTVKHIDYCEYTPLSLAEKNDMTIENFKWSVKFKDSIKLPNDHEHIFAQCKYNNHIIGESYLTRIIDKPKVETRSEEGYKIHLQTNKPAETLSVLFVGIDGMSKQNLIRTMPKTRNFIINNMNAKELNKFNKVGDNTYHNVVVLHSGYPYTELKNVNNFATNKDYFDKIEHVFLWHDYQKSGYRTAMMFDSIGGTAFHYLKAGWKKPTFDYYNRPVPLLMSKHAKKSQNKNCDGDKAEINLLLDYWLQLTSKFNNTKTRPYFAYSFFTVLSHDDQNEASMGDQMFLEFFREVHQRKVLNNTVVIFFSDHGMRFGSMMYTFNGKIEARSPFVFFMFPPWFEKKYPKEMSNFYVNQNRLTTFFDVHATLHDLLNFRGKRSEKLKKAYGKSLFGVIHNNRTCTDAKIPIQYCLCSPMSGKDVPEDLVNHLVKNLLRMINELTSKHRQLCAMLHLKKVISVLKVKYAKSTQFNSYYLVTIEASPGGGTFEASLLNDINSHKVTRIGNIRRLNLYRGQDTCVEPLDLKLYCYCL